MIDQIFEGPLQAMLEWACAGAFAAFPIFVLVLSADLLLRRAIAARYLVALWMMVALRFLFPVSVESPVSVMAPFEKGLKLAFQDQSPAQETNVSTFTFQDEDGDQLTVTLEDVPETATLEEVAAANQRAAAELNRAKRRAVAGRNRAVAPAPAAVSSSVQDWVDGVVGGIIVLWLLGVCVGFARLGIQWIVFSARLRSCSKRVDQEFVDEVLRVCDALGVGRRPLVREVPGLEVPAVFGILRPTICVPCSMESNLSGTELKLVLAHEIAHVKRWDGLWCAITQVVCVVQWINPITWVLASRVRHHVEQAADDLALRRMNIGSESDYGELLIRYALCEKPRQVGSIGLLMAKPGRALASRIRMLTKRRQRNHWAARVAGTLLVVAIAGVGLTDARTIKVTPEYEARVPQVDVIDISNDQQFHSLMEGGPTSTRTYDLRKALEKIAGEDTSTKERQLLSLFPEATSLGSGRYELTTSELQHRQVSQYIEAIEASGFCQITYTLRFIEGDLKSARESGILWQADSFSGKPDFSEVESSAADLLKVSPGGFMISELEIQPPTRPMLGARVNELQVRRLMTKFQSSERSNVLLAPKVTMFNGQVGVISDETRQAFVTGLRPIRLGDQVEVKPVIQSFADGLRIHLAGSVTEKDELAMKCMMRWSEIDDVVYSHYPVAGNQDSDALVQVPQVNTHSTTLGVTLKRGESVLIAAPDTFDDAAASDVATARFCLISAEWFPSP